LGSTKSKNIALGTAQAAFRVREIDHEVWVVVAAVVAVADVVDELDIAVGPVAALLPKLAINQSDKPIRDATAVCDALWHQDKM